MCKPDAVERGLSGEVVARLERKGLRLVAAELRQVDRAFAERHYAEHCPTSRSSASWSTFITRSPVLPMVVEGPADDTWQLVRTLMGATKVEDAQPGIDPRRSRHDDQREPRARLATAPSRPAREIAPLVPEPGLIHPLAQRWGLLRSDYED